MGGCCRNSKTNTFDAVFNIWLWHTWWMDTFDNCITFTPCDLEWLVISRSYDPQTTFLCSQKQSTKTFSVKLNKGFKYMVQVSPGKWVRNEKNIFLHVIVLSMIVEKKVRTLSKRRCNTTNFPTPMPSA